MPICKNNPKRHYTGKEPSPKGLGYCASSEKEGTIKKGRDGNMWIKHKGKWIKHKDDVSRTHLSAQSAKKDEEEEFEELLDLFEKKLYKWWQNLAEGNIIVIYKDGKHQLVKSSMKTFKAQVNDITKKWKDFQEDKDVKAIIWSAQSSDVLETFIENLIEDNSKNKIKELLMMKDLPTYIVDNYKKYFVKNKFIGEKDYTF